MSNDGMDLGTISALLERFNQQRLPRLLELKERVDKGEKLSDFDIFHLKEIMQSTQEISPLAERHPEYKPLVAQAISLYKEITDKAMENEQKS